MGMNYKTVGGGAATGLGNSWATFLQNGLNSGTFGAGSAASGAASANPAGSTTGIAGVLNDILSGGAGKLGGSLGQMIATQQKNDVENLRSRFGVGGGTAFGTPGQYAESTYRAQAAPQITSAIGNLQLGALSQIFPQIGALAQKGIPQAETVASQNPLTTGLGIAAPIVGGVLGGPLGASIGAGVGRLFGGGGSQTMGGGGGMSFNPTPGNFSAPSSAQWSAGMTGSSPTMFGTNFGFTPSFRF